MKFTSTAVFAIVTGIAFLAAGFLNELRAARELSDQVVVAREFRVVDEAGKERATFKVEKDGDTVFRMLDTSGRERIYLCASTKVRTKIPSGKTTERDFTTVRISGRNRDRNIELIADDEASTSILIKGPPPPFDFATDNLYVDLSVPTSGPPAVKLFRSAFPHNEVFWRTPLP